MEIAPIAAPTGYCNPHYDCGFGSAVRAFGT